LLYTFQPDENVQYFHLTSLRQRQLEQLFNSFFAQQMFECTVDLLVLVDGLDESSSDPLYFSAYIVDPCEEAHPLQCLLNSMSSHLLPKENVLISSRPCHLSHELQFTVQVLGLMEVDQNELVYQTCKEQCGEFRQLFRKNPDTRCHYSAPVLFYMKCLSLHLSEKELGHFRRASLACKVYIRPSTHGRQLTSASSPDMDIEVKNYITDNDQVFHFTHVVWEEFFTAVNLSVIALDDITTFAKWPTEISWSIALKFAFGLKTFGYLMQLFSDYQRNKIQSNWEVRKKAVINYAIGVDQCKRKLPCNEFNKLLQICTWIRERGGEIIMQKATTNLPKEIYLPENSMALGSDISALFYLLKHSRSFQELYTQACLFIGDSRHHFTQKLECSFAKVRCSLIVFSLLCLQWFLLYFLALRFYL